MFIDNYLEGMMNSLNQLYSHPLVVIALTVFLGIASYTDLRALKIPDKLNLAFLVVRFALIPILGFSMFDVAGGLIAFFALLIPAMIKMHKMGGDIKCGAVLGLYVGAFLVPVFFLTACLYGLLYVGISFLFGKKVGLVPFAPFFLLSHLTLLSFYYVWF